MRGYDGERCRDTRIPQRPTRGADSACAAQRCARLLLELEQPLLILPSQRQDDAVIHQHL